MRFFNLIKTIPLLSTLLLIIFLSISNQKEYTKIRILIWDTPSLTLGTYLAISSGSGFILSYILTANLASIIKSRPNQSLKFKEENKNQYNYENKQINKNSSYERTLIERDFNDPSPTINASFRVIGKIQRHNENSLNLDNNNQYEESTEFVKDFNEQYENDANVNQQTSKSTDWNDDSFTSW